VVVPEENHNQTLGKKEVSIAELNNKSVVLGVTESSIRSQGGGKNTDGGRGRLKVKLCREEQTAPEVFLKTPISGRTLVEKGSRKQVI